MTVTDYNVIAELGVTPTPNRSAGWMDALASYCPAVGRTARGQTELIITVPARSLEQAVTTGLAVMARAADPDRLERFEVLATAEYDRRLNDVQMPDLVGATEAAELLNVTRQRIQQMAAAGQLPRMQVGKTLVFPLATIEAMAAGARETVVPGS
jgi:excisionase family DNA binding protein